MLIYERDEMFSDIHNHKEVIDECKGCKNIHKRFNKYICSCHCFPHTMWWFENCPQATHIKQPIEEDPVKEP